MSIRRSYTFFILFLLLLTLAFLSLFLGRYSVQPLDVLQILSAHSRFGEFSGVENTVVWDIRLPRVLLVILVGAGLSAAGAAYQGCFHNPLVSPDLLGVSAGAGFGAALGILLTSGVGVLTQTLAFGFGLLSVLLSWLLSRVRNESTILSLVLSGIIVSAVFNALISLLKFVADTESQLPAITYWLMGSFSNTTFEDLQIVTLPIMAGIGLLLGFRWHINVLTLGDEEARALGVNPVRIRVVIIVASTVITASAVMVTGIIGWVGLIIPNLCRMMFGADYKYVMPASCLSGAMFMLVVDFIARVLTPAEIPIGILIAIVGAPFFALIYKSSDGH